MARNRQSSPQTKAVLAALADRPEEWRHGYDLSKQTGLKSGTLYPLLIRLSESGILTADWREPERAGKPPRHVYRLTPQGLALALEQLRGDAFGQALSTANEAGGAWHATDLKGETA